MSDDSFAALAESLPDSFSKTMLAGAVAALQADNPLRAHHFATSLRELIGYLLHKLGPDEQVVSAHTQIEGIQVDNVEVVSIGLDAINYAVEGTVYVQLVWGSGSDFDRGDGATLSDCFPFTCSVAGSVQTLSEFSEASRLDVDTSSWYED